jgi:SAM-dependent methyltransferase
VADDRLSFSANFLDGSRITIYTPQTVRAILADLDPPAGGSIVEIGAGTGFLLDHIKKAVGQGREAIAVDIDADLLPNRDDITSIVASGDNVPRPDGSAAVVATHFVLSRVALPIAQGIIREAHRLLMDGGQLMLVEPCLGLSMYHSDRDSELTVMMSLARIEKARLNAQLRDIDENIGLHLHAMVDAVGLTLEVDDIHVARWYSAFPTWASSDLEWMAARVADLEKAGGRQFLNAHDDGATTFAESESAFVVHGGQVRLTEAGFAMVQQARIDDLQSRMRDLTGGPGPVEMIPVVRVVARKES